MTVISDDIILSFNLKKNLSNFFQKFQSPYCKKFVIIFLEEHFLNAPYFSYMFVNA